MATSGCGGKMGGKVVRLRTVEERAKDAIQDALQEVSGRVEDGDVVGVFIAAQTKDGGIFRCVSSGDTWFLLTYARTVADAAIGSKLEDMELE